MAVNYKQNLEGVYENIELGKVQPTIEQHYASLDTKLQNENVYQDIEILSEISSVKNAPQKREKKKAISHNYLWVIAVVAMAASILAIVGVIIVAGVYVSALQENTATLTRQIVELENKLNQTQEITNQVHNIQRFDDNIMMIDKLNSIQAVLNTTTEQLSSFQSSVNTLTTRVNSPVNLYQNCIQETRSCVRPALGPTWVTFCTTNPLPANITVSFMSFMQSSVICKRLISCSCCMLFILELTRVTILIIRLTTNLFIVQGYYTLDMRCQFDRQPDFTDHTVLRSPGDGHYHCLCYATSVNGDIGLEIFSFPTFTCTLVVTRCPLLNRLY